MFYIVLHKNGFGGIESYMESLLLELQSQRLMVEVYIHNDVSTSNLLSLSSRGGYLKYFLRTWWRKDGVHIINNNISILLSHLFFRKNKIILLHGIPKRSFWFYYLVSTLNSGKVIANSIKMADFYEKRFGKRLDIVYPMLREEILCYEKDYSRVADNIIRIGYLGRITIDKQIEEYIYVHNELCALGVKSTLLLQGAVEFAYKEKLMALSTHKNLVIFEDFKQEVHSFYNRVDLVFYYANHYESYGITIAESLYFGKKVVIPDKLSADFKDFCNIFVYKKESFVITDIMDFLITKSTQLDKEFNQKLILSRQKESINYFIKNDRRNNSLV